MINIFSRYTQRNIFDKKS